jgi:paraquat-inducible protein B
VIATIEMNKAAAAMTKGTRFWLVKPSVSLAGISGLETLVSGNYIAVSRVRANRPSASPRSGWKPAVVRCRARPAPDLKADRLGSLNRDSPVFYKQIQVGRVKSYRLSEDQSTVEIKVFIEPAYASLRKHTRF